MSIIILAHCFSRRIITIRPPFILQAALQLKPNFAAAVNGLGAAMLYKGNIEQAIFLFKKSLEIDPEYIDAQMNLKNVSDYLQQAGAKKR